MDRSIRECECGHCGYPLTFHNVSPDAYLCPRCALTNWIPIYKLSENDERFLRSLRIEPTVETR
jgi:hypothetical protein